MRRRGEARDVLASASRPSEPPALDPETFANARKDALGYDVSMLRADRLAFAGYQNRPVTDTDEAFLGVCRGRHKRAPLG